MSSKLPRTLNSRWTSQGKNSGPVTASSPSHGTIILRCILEEPPLLTRKMSCLGLYSILNLWDLLPALPSHSRWAKRLPLTSRLLLAFKKNSPAGKKSVSPLIHERPSCSPIRERKNLRSYILRFRAEVV